ncbi:arrestin domain-containing protein 3-like [Brachyhypopomus gauderio]|uniref:arrestin domain-containing protein 3-like n=1 Tax=Brachyhypopomus gauderio TaxID=698409 RepID=UPI0040411AD0
MAATIKHFSVNYDPINENDTFTNGSLVEGRVVLEVTKDLKVNRLYLKCKGEADVHWTESNSDTDDSYSAHERYFKLKQIFIQDESKKEKNKGATIVHGETYNNLVIPGSHVFPFRFQLPQRNMPSSFKGFHGSIKYVLEARLCRAWKRACNASKEFTFVSGVYEDTPYLMKPLSGVIEKKMKLFTSGSASVKATTDKMGYMQGEIITVEADIENSSSRDLKLKYKLEQKQTFTAQSHHNYSTTVIFKVVSDPIPSKSKRSVASKLKIPPDASLSIANCDIIKVEYILKVYLDIPYARDPEVLFPIIILPADQYFIPQRNEAGVCASAEMGKPGWSSYPSQPAPSPCPPAASTFGPAPGLYPSLHTPQPANPEGPPPSYTDIFPTSIAVTSGLHPSPLPSALSAPPCPPQESTTSTASYHHPVLECPSALGYCQGPLYSEFYPTTTSQ